VSLTTGAFNSAADRGYPVVGLSRYRRQIEGEETRMGGLDVSIGISSIDDVFRYSPRNTRCKSRSGCMSCFG